MNKSLWYNDLETPRVYFPGVVSDLGLNMNVLYNFRVLSAQLASGSSVFSCLAF